MPVVVKVKERLDRLMVGRGLVESRTQAQRLIMAGRVRVDGEVSDKPGALVPCDAQIVVFLPKYVSRGGEKLAAALSAFHVDPTQKVCLDIGASTGGFTDCLLQHGAKRVHAVDVGRGQLEWKLRNDPRVVVHERLNARHLKFADIGEAVDLATVDVSFISLRLVLPPLGEVMKPEGDVIALVKPQFEAGRERVGRGGVVRDPKIHREVLAGIVAFAQGELSWSMFGAIPSPLRGPAGNREFLLHLVPRPHEDHPIDWDRVVF